MIIGFLLISVFSAFGNATLSLLLTPLASVSETVANQIGPLSNEDNLGRSNFIISDQSGLLYTNKYHIKMMSHIGKNNSIFTKYNNNLQKVKVNNMTEEANIFAYGITNCGDGYVYGQTANPYDIKIVKGNYSPISPLFDDSINSNVRGCLISESLSKRIFKDANPISKQVTFNVNNRDINFLVSAVVQDPCLCNEYQNENEFIMTNFVFMQSLFEGQCFLTLRLKNNYYTNLSIFQRFFVHVYIKGYSTQKLTINSGDNRLDNYIDKMIVQKYNAPDVIYYSYFTLLIQIGFGWLMSYLFEIKKMKISFAKCCAIVFLIGGLSFVFADSFNNLPIDFLFYNSKAINTTIFIVIGILIFTVSFILFNRFKYDKLVSCVSNLDYSEIDI